MTAASESDYTPAYTLDNTWEAARDRLETLEVSCDPYTASHLDKIGVAPGWHCLEVGAGAGSVTRMLCDRVGPDGHVLAVDLEPTLLADLSLPNLEVRRLDVVIGRAARSGVRPHPHPAGPGPHSPAERC